MPQCPPRKVFHYHLKKCGGTSLNAWIDLQGPDSTAWSSVSNDLLSKWMLDGREAPDITTLQARLRAVATAAFHVTDSVHSHLPMLPFAPPGTVCVTVLREPASRIISQIADWRRLGPHDRARLAPRMQACLADAQLMRVSAFLEKNAHEAGRQMMDNYLVRALAASRLGPLVRLIEDAADLLPIAMEVLENDFDLIGLAEQDYGTRNDLCAAVGWCPAPLIPRLNETQSALTLREEAADASHQLNDLTQFDTILYERACVLVAARQRDRLQYDIAQFEATAVMVAVGRLRAVLKGEGQVAFTVRQPLIGFGFQGRDAANTSHCAVWTGPGSVARLYMPAPAGTRITVLLWIRGYACESERQHLRVRVDGTAAEHRLEQAEGYRDRLAVDVFTVRPFISLEVEIAPRSCVGSDQLGQDARLRGLSFDSYGWVTL